MSRSPHLIRRRPGATAAAALLRGACSASAAPVVWDGAGGNGNTYDVILDGSASWDAARAAAQASGGDLATIESQAEQDFVETVLGSNNAPTGSYWFGLREAAEGVWQHVDGSPAGFTNWSPAEPNNVQGVEDVGAILWTNTTTGGTPDPAGVARSGKWNDAPTSGLPAPGLPTPVPDAVRAGYLLEVTGDGNGNGGGGTVIPLPAAVYAFPLGAAVVGLFHRRMRRRV